MNNLDNYKLKALFNENFIRLSKPMINKLGLKVAVFLCEIYAEYDYWFKKKKVNEYGYFHSTIENVEKSTGLSAYEQRAAIEILKDYGILQMHLYGMPAVRYFKLNSEGLDKLYKELVGVNNEQTKVDEFINPGEKQDYQRPSNGHYDPSKVARSIKDIDLRRTF